MQAYGAVWRGGAPKGSDSSSSWAVAAGHVVLGWAGHGEWKHVLWIVRELGSVDCLVSPGCALSKSSLLTHRPPSSSVRHAALPSVGRSIHFYFSSLPSPADPPVPASPPSRSGTNSRTRRATRTPTIAKGRATWLSPDSVSSPLRTATWRPSESSVSPFPLPSAHSSLPSAATKLSCEDSRSTRLVYPPTDTHTVRNSRPSPETGQSLPRMPSSACECLRNLLLSMPLFVPPYLAQILPAQIASSD